MSKTKISVFIATAILLFYLLAPIAYAQTEDLSVGTAVVGNSAPTMANPGLWDSGDSADKNNTALVVQTEYHFNVSITDNNQLYDLENVTFIIFDSTFSTVDGADANETHYTFKYLNSTDAFTEVGPDAAGGHIVTGNCVKPANRSEVTGVYKLAFKLEKTANYTGTTSWTINATVYDGSDDSANVQTIIFSVAAYYEITVVDATHGWTGLSAGSTNATLTSPVAGYITCTITSNNDFKLQSKSFNASLTSGGDTIPIANILIHQTTLADAIELTVGYLDIVGLTAQTRGWAQSKTFELWINIPGGTPNGSYVYTLGVQVAAA